MSTLEAKHQLVERRLRQEIRSGRWAPNQLFETEQTLTERFGVSRPTLRRSLKALEDEGLLVRRQGRGTFIGDLETAGRRTVPIFINQLTDQLQGQAREILLQLIDGISGVLQARGDHPMVRATSREDLREDLPRWLDQLPGTRQPGAALIVEPSFCPELRSFLARRGWDVWSINEPTPDCHSVYVDQQQAGYLAAEYLLDQGCRRIALLNGPVDAYWGFAAKQRGYQAALEARGLTIDPALILQAHHPVDSEAGRAMFAELLRDEVAFDGVIGCSDMKAIGAAAAAREAGFNVPAELRVVAIDRTLTQTLASPLPAVGMPYTQVGCQAARQALYVAGQSDRRSNVPVHICIQPLPAGQDGFVEPLSPLEGGTFQ